jgi:hypothetical protein
LIGSPKDILVSPFVIRKQLELLCIDITSPLETVKRIERFPCPPRKILVQSHKKSTPNNAFLT